jgi:hypothetical protein
MNGRVSVLSERRASPSVGIGNMDKGMLHLQV